VCKLSKALYGLKQAPRAWYECLRDFLIANAFKVGKANPTLFTKTCDGDLFVCQIYVDDIIFGSTNQKSCEEFSRVTTQKFEMSMMGELSYFLGFQVKQLKDGTFISQMKYTQDLIKWFGMKDAKPAKTPMGTDGHTDLIKGGKSVDQKAYRSMIGSLLYLCASRPDIMLSVCMCARFQFDPRECHSVAVKRILRYLVSTPCFGICYPKGSTFDLIGYSDSDYAGCKVDRKSTSGTCQFLRRSLVSLSHPVLEGKPNANHVRARISYSRTQQLHNMDIITQCSNSIKRELIVDYIVGLRHPYSSYNKSKCGKET
jgi:hypothetical protein